MQDLDRLAVKGDLSTKVMMVLISLLGLVAAVLCGVCFYLMDVAGLLAYSGFLLFAAILIGCAGAVLVYLREERGLN